MDIYELTLEIGLRVKKINSINLKSPRIQFEKFTYFLSLISSNGILIGASIIFFVPWPKSLMNGNYSLQIFNFIMTKKDIGLIEILVGFTKNETVGN